MNNLTSDLWESHDYDKIMRLITKRSGIIYY